MGLNIVKGFKGTSGTWIVQKNSEGIVVRTEESRVAYVYHSDKESECNAALISQAPNLLEQLKGAVEFLVEEGYTNQVKQMRRVIKRAENIPYADWESNLKF